MTNPIEIQQGTAKPNLVEIGPYCFNGKIYTIKKYKNYLIYIFLKKEILEKKNVNFLNKDSIEFYPVNTIHFEKDGCSNGSIDDHVTFLNVPITVC